MKNKRLIAGVLGALVLIIVGVLVSLNSGLKITLESDFEDNSVIEYTGEAIQFPMAYVEKGIGEIVSYDVSYEVVNLSDNSRMEDKYATFELKCGEYKFICKYEEDASVKKEIHFTVKDTLSPEIEFMNIPNGVFLQDIEEGEAPKLPLYTIDDASMDDGIQLEKTLYFMGEEDADYQEYKYKEINNSYVPEAFGKFKYVLVATDVHGNKTEAVAEWKIKDRTWKPGEIADGYLADYSSEEYTNLIESGDANQYYKIGDDYTDTWHEEFEGAEGVLEIDMGFNTATGRGSNALRLYFARNFTKEDIAGKYLAVRMYVEADNMADHFLMSGNIVALRDDQTTRAFSTQISGFETGKWVTYYIDAETVQNIGVYNNSKYNSSTTFYEGGDEATQIQLCFFRKAGFNNRMKLYVDSISLAEKLPETAVTVKGNKASWEAVKGAVGYKVNVNGEETLVDETKYTLDTKKGYIRVTPLGDGVLTLDGEESVAVYGLDAGNNLASFDDDLYTELFSDKLKFSSDSEHFGYKPKTMSGAYTNPGVTLELGTGEWGICTGTRILFPEAKAKGSNTTLELNMYISNAKYRVMRVYDYDGVFLGEIQLTSENTGKYHNFQVDLSGYDKSMKGVQLIFGPSANMVNVANGVTLKFKNIRYVDTYFDIEVNGQTMKCVGEKFLVPGYTQADLVQFVGVYNFGVAANDTPLSFEGTVRLDGKILKASEFQVVGYPDSDVICFKVAHGGKVLTIDAGSIIYYGGKAVKIGETFNSQWTGEGYAWKTIAEVPNEPAKEYVTINGEQYELVNSVALKPGHTQKDLVQFLNVNDFEVKEDNTPLSFEGTILLNGKALRTSDYSIYGYPNNTTVTLNVVHYGNVLTIMKGSIIYHGNQAVEITETFNAIWDGTNWQAVAEIPAAPEQEYYTTASGKQIPIVKKVILQGAYTQNDLVQFENVNNFEVELDNTPLAFDGTVLLDGVKLENAVFVGYPRSSTICLNALHKDKVLTIMAGSVIYTEDQAIVVAETFNAKWTGEGYGTWEAVAEIPTPPEPEHVTLKDGTQKEVVAKVELTPGYTADNLVQFTNVFDFGVGADDTASAFARMRLIRAAEAEDIPLGFEGTVLIDGVKVENPKVVGYKGLSTICFKDIVHRNKVLTIMEGSVIYYGDKAVVIKETFNAKWTPDTYNTWVAEEEIPKAPEKEYVTVDGEQKEVVGKVELTSGHTAETLVQFTNVYDFGATADDTALGFNGTVLIDGVEVENPKVVGYNGSSTICLKDVAHKNKVLTIKEGSVIYYGDKAVVVTKTFNAKWDGSTWTEVAEIPTPPEKEYVTLGGEQKEVVGNVELTVHHTGESLVQFSNVYDFGVTDNTVLDFYGTVLLNGEEASGYSFLGYGNSTTICLNNLSYNGKAVTIEAGSYVGYGDKVVRITEDFHAIYYGGSWYPVTKEVTLTPGTTTQSSVEFTNVYDFGGTEDKNLTFIGDVTLNGVRVDSPQFVSKAGSDEIVLNVEHQGKILKIAAGSGLTDGNSVIVITEDLYAIWNGTTWVNIVGETTLTAGHTDTTLVQFTNVYDFGVTDNTVLDFYGTVLLNGEETSGYSFLGYGNNTTICLNNLSHNGNVVTVKAGSLVGYGDKAVLVTEDFHAIWSGSGNVWLNVPATVNKVVAKITLTPGYTTTGLVQFNDAYDLGVPADATALSFYGEALLNGEAVSNVQFIGYANNTIVCLNNINHAGQILTIKAGSLIYYGDKAVVVNETFNAIWNGSTWMNVVGENSLTPGYNTDALVQFTGFYDFGVPNSDTELLFQGTVLLNGNPATEGDDFHFVGYPTDTTICFKLTNAATDGTTVTIKAGSLVGYGTKAVLINNDLSATYNGAAWTLN